MKLEEVCMKFSDGVQLYRMASYTLKQIVITVINQ